jgi:dTDP-4-amino-4,6-dideoxygalactose transaminase
LGDAPYGPTLLNVEKFNKEMSPVSARIGLIQFMKLNNMLEKRRRNASILEEGIKGIDFLEAPQILKNTNPSFLCYTVSVKTENLKEDRIKIINELNKKNIEANNYIWPYAIHQIPDYQKVCELGVNDFSGTDKVIRSIINIPVHPLLEEKDMERIVRTISAIDL